MSLLGDMALAIKQKLLLKLDASAYTPADVLTKLKTVDGTGSGLDADLLKGLNVVTTNTANTVVARDASGNFSANIITANLTGNSATATKLATLRTINGVGFDGTANITIEDSTKLPLAGGTLTGPLLGTSFNGITGLSSTAPIVDGVATIGVATTAARADHIHPAQTTVTGNAGTATALQTGRTISITGDLIYTSPAFTGAANITAVGTLANSGVTAGTYNNNNTSVQSFTVDAKGRITAINGLTTITPNWSSITNKPNTVAGYNITDVYTASNTYSKSEVDSLVQGFRGKASVSAATTSALTFNTAQTVIDGVTLTASDRVLIKNQTNATQNGIYTNVTTTSWTRATNADTAEELLSAFVFVDSGTVNKDSAWLQTSDNIVIGTTDIVWIQFSSSGSYAPAVHTHTTADITSGVFPVARGGTGVSTITGILKGNGTGAFSTAKAGTDYVIPSGSITGNATTATRLQTIRTINGVNFDGTYDIVITDDTKQPVDGDLTSIAGLTGTTGLLRKTAANTWSLDTTDYVTSVGISLPLTSTGGSTPTLGINLATTTTDGAMSAADKSKLNNVANNANNYVLPIASTSVLGGVKAGANITIDARGVISATGGGVSLSDVFTKTQIQESLPAIGFDTTNSVAPIRLGQSKWNKAEGTADLVLDNGVVIQLGQGIIRKARNSSGATIPIGRLVKTVPTTGNSDRLEIALSNGTEAEVRNVYGVTAKDILNGAEGYVVISGVIKGIDTTGASSGEIWSKGDLLYAKLNGNGLLTNMFTEGTSTYVIVGRVIHPHVNGILDININSALSGIDASVGNSGLNGAYGVTWNNETNIYTRIGNDFTQIQKLMKRCVLNFDGTVRYFLDANDSTKKEDGALADLTGASGNVMVQIPKFYYKHIAKNNDMTWLVSLIPQDGFGVHPAFKRGNIEVDFRYYRAYTGYVSGGKLLSRSGVNATSSLTISQFRTYAMANGSGWSLTDWNLLHAIQVLFLTEYATFNSQSVLGDGNHKGSDYGMVTGQSNIIGNGSSGVLNSDKWMSYRGIENFYADIWEFIDGINIQNYIPFVNNNLPSTYISDVFTGDYVNTGVTMIAGASATFVKKVSKEFFPTVAGGDSNSFLTDGFWSNTGNRTVLFGGDALNGLLGGAFCLIVIHAASAAAVHIGAGIAF